jgi:hypothetical protein
MGYTTEFKGELRFTRELTGKELAAVSNMLGEDCRDHPEWGTGDSLSYIDLELTNDFGGLKWDGSEKTYDLEKKVNVLIKQVRKEVPDFGLTGSLLAQGESVDDRWALVIGENGFATRQEVALSGKVVTCPHCDEKFVLEEAKDKE